MNWNKQTIFFPDWINLLCLHVADPATFLASNSILALISSENSLYIQPYEQWILLD